MRRYRVRLSVRLFVSAWVHSSEPSCCRGANAGSAHRRSSVFRLGANPPLSFPPSPPLALEEGHISPLSFHPVLSPFPSLISRPLKSSWESAVSDIYVARSVNPSRRPTRFRFSLLHHQASTHTTILALPGASLHYVGMKQPKKKPAVPGCSNWTSLELRYYYYYHQRKTVLENEYSAPHQTTVHSDTWRSSAIGCLKPTWRALALFAHLFDLLTISFWGNIRC